MLSEDTLKDNKGLAKRKFWWDIMFITMLLGGRIILGNPLDGNTVATWLAIVIIFLAYKPRPR